LQYEVYFCPIEFGVRFSNQTCKVSKTAFKTNTS